MCGARATSGFALNASSSPSLCSRSALLAALLWLSSCSGGGGQQAPSAATPTAVAPDTPAVTRPIVQSDLQIAEAIYAADVRTPPGFLSDPAPSGHPYATTEHLKNQSLSTAQDASAPLFELCTDDWNQALEWSETSARAARAYAELVATQEDTRYFEFGRVRSGEPSTYLRSRIFKCSYLDRSVADLHAAAGPAGALKARPLTAQELQHLSEYLWQFTTYNNFGSAVLSSAGEAASQGLAHTLHIAHRALINERCDGIDVIAWRHHLDANTGALTLETRTLWQFGARERAGLVELCTLGSE